MGKVTATVGLRSLFDKTKPRVVAAVVDTGAALLVLPQEIIDELGPRKVREVRVRRGNNALETKGVYGAVTVELRGRVRIFEALAEAPGSQPLVGQVVLESLDLVLDPSTRAVTSDLRSAETPWWRLCGPRPDAREQT